VPSLVLNPERLETDVEIEEAEDGVTAAQLVPTRISSMSALGVAEEFRIHIDENVVTVDVPEVLEIPPLGSLPPNDDGFTQIVEMSGEAPLKSCLTTTR
jgi:hypothetical protein